MADASEIEATLSKLGLSGLGTRRIATRLLSGERLSAKKIRREGGSHAGVLADLCRKLEAEGIRCGRRTLARPEGANAGRAPIEYWVLAEGEEIPDDEKIRPPGHGIGGRIHPKKDQQQLDVVAAPSKPAKKQQTRVYPKGMSSLPPLPDFGQGLMTTGLLLNDDGAVEVHLRNGEGTFIAELTGYRAMTARG